MENDELLTRVQNQCQHDWHYASGPRQCQKCGLLWEVWAERRITLLEARVAKLETDFAEAMSDELDDDDENFTPDGMSFHVALRQTWILLPPQTENTCPHCDGTGHEPFGEALAVCLLCSVVYDPSDLERFAPTDLAPCGHAIESMRLVDDCIRCHGSGVR